MIMESFGDAILMSMREARHEGNSGAAEHRAFVDAIEAGDATWPGKSWPVTCSALRNAVAGG